MKAFERLIEELCNEHRKEVLALAGDLADARQELLALKRILHEHANGESKLDKESSGRGALHAGLQSSNGNQAHQTAQNGHTLQIQQCPQVPTSVSQSPSEGASGRGSGAAKPQVPRWSREHLIEIVEGDRCELVVATLVIINSLVMAVEMQYLGLRSGYALGVPGIGNNVEDTWPGAELAFMILERTFTTIFAVELCLRLAVLQSKFFANWMCLVDILAVAVGIADWAISGESLVNTAVVRLLRLVRVARGLRVFNVGKVIESLHLILHTMASSIHTLFWSLVVLTIVQCIMGMIFGQIVRDYVADPNNSTESRLRVYKFFGTFTRTMVSMYEILLANWSPPCRVLMEDVNEMLAWLVIVYRCIAGFAVLNVISAVFIQQTMDISRNNHEMVIMQKSKAHERYKHMLLKLFRELDASGDGHLSRDELGQLITNPAVVEWMTVLDMEPRHVMTVFDMFDYGSGSISTNEFIMGASRLKGPATNIDMARVLCMLGRMEESFAELQMLSTTAQQCTSDGTIHDDEGDSYLL